MRLHINKRWLAWIAISLLCVGCANHSEYTADFFAMNTTMSVRIDAKDASQLGIEVQQRVNALDRLLSRTNEKSAIYQINHSEGATEASDASSYIAFALKMAEKTDGYFDPTVAVLTDLWEMGTENAHVPTQAEIDEALTHVGYQNIALSGDGKTVQLKNGAQIDLGGIAKGMAADETAAIVTTSESNANALLSLGGNIYAVGTKSGSDWHVGIAEPDNSAEYVAIVSASNCSVVTTGDYERYFEQDGKRYHHIFDPHTGYPAESDLRSVSVIGEKSGECDAYATALFVMGLEKAQQFCKENNIEAVFITSDKRVIPTDGLKGQIEFTGEDKGYTYEA